MLTIFSWEVEEREHRFWFWLCRRLAVRVLRSEFGGLINFRFQGATYKANELVKNCEGDAAVGD